MIGSLRPSTRRQYTVYISKFLKFCNVADICNFMPSEVNVINFLQELYDSGLSYSVINTACSAVKTFLELVDIPVHFTAKLDRFKKGIFNERPSLPRHVSIWDPQIVLDYFERNSCITNQYFLTCKCITLLALASSQRVSTLHSLKLQNIRISHDKLVLNFTSLHKQSRPGSHLTGIDLPSFPNKNLCVVQSMKRYLDLVEPLRTEQLDALFITCTKPYKNASKDTISRWIKTTLHKAGVPPCFTAHSTRAASTSADARKGINLMAIMHKAGWSSVNTFHKFYNKALL